MREQTSGISVSLGELPPLTELQEIWCTLEVRAESSFFLSWIWIGAWLESLPSSIKLSLLQVERNGIPIGLGILSSRKIKRHGFLRSRALYLHDTGDPLLDEITVEHNGFLAERGSEGIVPQASIEFLLSKHHHWDEIFLDGLRQTGMPSVPKMVSARLRTLKRSACHVVDLEGLRSAGGDYLSQLGKNSRYSIRRSMRSYEKHGVLQLVEAESAMQAHEFMNRLQYFHQRYWQQKGQQGSFANPFFNSFHHRLIDDGFKQGAIQMLKITAGDSEIGYLYNFAHRGRVYNYQSGFNYDQIGPHDRPGLVSHTKAVEHNMSKGFTIYDFMAGDSDYKKSLGTAVEQMTWEVIQKNQLKFRIEDALRTVKQRVLRILMVFRSR